MSSKREELIEEAAKAAYEGAFLKHAPEDVDHWSDLVADGDPAVESWREVARQTLAVFEAAQAPAGGELLEELLPKVREVFDRLTGDQLVWLARSEWKAAMHEALTKFHGPPARTEPYENGPGEQYEPVGYPSLKEASRAALDVKEGGQ